MQTALRFPPMSADEFADDLRAIANELAANAQWLDEICNRAPALAERVNDVPDQDRLEKIADGLRAVAASIAQEA